MLFEPPVITLAVHPQIARTLVQIPKTSVIIIRAIVTVSVKTTQDPLIQALPIQGQQDLLLALIMEEVPTEVVEVGQVDGEQVDEEAVISRFFAFNT